MSPAGVEHPVQVLSRRALPADEAGVLALLRQHDGLEVDFAAP